MAMLILALATGLVVAFVVLGLVILGGLGVFVARRRRSGGVIATRRKPR